MIYKGNKIQNRFYVGTDTAPTAYLGDTLVQGNAIPIPPPWDAEFLTVECIEPGVLNLNNGNSNNYTNSSIHYRRSVTNEYSKLGFNTTSISLQKGEYVRVYGGQDRITPFSISSDSGLYVVKGKLTSLQSSASTETQSGIFAFYKLFQNFTGLLDATELIWPTNVTTECYEYMFNNCLNLRAVSQISGGIDSYSFRYMFQGCNKLIQAPDLPNGLSNYCYAYIFNNCLNLMEVHVGYNGGNPANNSHGFEGWLNNNPQAGMIYSPSSKGWNKSSSRMYIPSSWSVVDEILNSETDITLNTPESINVTVDGYTILDVIPKPSKALRTATYTSSNPNVVTVDKYGIVRGISEGTATITVSIPDYIDTARNNIFHGMSVQVPVTCIAS